MTIKISSEGCHCLSHLTVSPKGTELIHYDENYVAHFDDKLSPSVSSYVNETEVRTILMVTYVVNILLFCICGHEKFTHCRFFLHFRILLKN